VVLVSPLGKYFADSDDVKFFCCPAFVKKSPGAVGANLCFYYPRFLSSILRTNPSLIATTLNAYDLPDEESSYRRHDSLEPCQIFLDMTM
jgi:hypothetical protein